MFHGSMPAVSNAAARAFVQPGLIGTNCKPFAMCLLSGVLYDLHVCLMCGARFCEMDEMFAGFQDRHDTNLSLKGLNRSMDCLREARAVLQDEHKDPAAVAQALNVQIKEFAKKIAGSLAAGTVAVTYTVLHPASPADRVMPRSLLDPGVLALVVRAQDPEIDGCLINGDAALSFCNEIRALTPGEAAPSSSSAEGPAKRDSHVQVADCLIKAELLLKLPQNWQELTREGDRIQNDSAPRLPSQEATSVQLAEVTQQRAGVLKALHRLLLEPLISKQLIPEEASRIVFVPDQVGSG